MPSVFFQAVELQFSLQELPERKPADKILLCSPDHFDIIDEKNVHMQGNIGRADKNEAWRQWRTLKGVYESLLKEGALQELSIIPGAEGCEDMVFCANQSFPWEVGGKKQVVMSNMRHASRQKEVTHFETFFKEKGFDTAHLPPAISFEGMGDLIPHPGRRLLYGGYGHRTSGNAYEVLAIMLDTDILALELVSPKFYHLDTCFVPLSEDSVMLCKDAFSTQGLELIARMFKQVHVVPGEEAVQHFSLNAHVFEAGGRRIAILQEGSSITKEILVKEGFELIELDTSEFMRSGGSVFCMKMEYT